MIMWENTVDLQQTRPSDTSNHMHSHLNQLCLPSLFTFLHTVHIYMLIVYLSISQVVDLLIKVLLSALWLMVWRPKEKHGMEIL